MKHQILNLESLDKVRQRKQSIVVPKSTGWAKPKPAAVMINLPGHVLLDLFRYGMFVYEKEGTK